MLELDLTMKCKWIAPIVVAAIFSSHAAAATFDVSSPDGKIRVTVTHAASNRVPATWDEVKFVAGCPASHTVIARRKGADWFVGGMTAKARTLAVPLSFLKGEGAYQAEIFRDREAGLPMATETKKLGRSDVLTLAMLDRGGFVVRLSPLPAAQKQSVHQIGSLMKRLLLQLLAALAAVGPALAVEGISPEQGGLVMGPTMDQQIIRSLFGAVAEAARRLGVDAELAAKLDDMKKRIAPNKVGKHGQLQEWMEDNDDPIIQLLPALPKAWLNVGMCARQGAASQRKEIQP